jgi:serine-type D-Ala-D-Ala endopeptidase (penicillin-binding protein 7)
MKTRCYALFLTFFVCALAMPLHAAEHDTQRVLHVWEQLNPKKLKLQSKGVLITDEFGNTLYSKHADEPRPIASLTKLMTAMVVLDSGLDLDQPMTVTKADRDLLRLTGSRLRVGARLTRRDLLTLALMSSENRAARALARSYPGGMKSFVRAMNAKAHALHMYDSHFADPAGLDEHNVASPADLVRMVNAASHYPLIAKATTRKSMQVHPYKRRGPLRYVNTNRLLRNSHWDIRLSKTGYINEAGRCLVMRVNVAGSDMVMVFLDSFGKLTPFGDANRTLKWLKTGVIERTQVADAGKSTVAQRTSSKRPKNP